MECTLCRFCDNPRFPHTSCLKSDNSHPQRKRPPIRNPNGTAGHRPGKPRFLRPETTLHYTRRIFRQQTHVQHTGRKGLYLWHILLYRSHAIRKLFNHIDPNRNRIHPPAHRRSLRRNRSTQKRARPDRRVHHRTKLPERRHGSYSRLPLFHSGLLPFIESQRSPCRIFCAARRSHTATVTRRSTIDSTKISRPLTILHSRRRRQKQNSPALPTLINSFSSTTPPIVTRHPNATGGGVSHIEEVARSNGGVENGISSAGLYWTFNSLARWALPLYRYATQGERAKMRFKYLKLLHCRAP